jgi:hypothetical protein
MLLLLTILILVFGFGGGYYGNTRYPGWGGPGFGVGTILIVCLLIYLLGGFRR